MYWPRGGTNQLLAFPVTSSWVYAPLLFSEDFWKTKATRSPHAQIYIAFGCFLSRFLIKSNLNNSRIHIINTSGYIPSFPCSMRYPHFICDVRVALERNLWSSSAWLVSQAQKPRIRTNVLCMIINDSSIEFLNIIYSFRFSFHGVLLGEPQHIESSLFKMFCVEMRQGWFTKKRDVVDEGCSDSYSLYSLSFPPTTTTRRTTTTITRRRGSEAE